MSQNCEFSSALVQRSFKERSHLASQPPSWRFVRVCKGLSLPAFHTITLFFITLVVNSELSHLFPFDSFLFQNSVLWQQHRELPHFRMNGVCCQCITFMFIIRWSHSTPHKYVLCAAQHPNLLTFFPHFFFACALSCSHKPQKVSNGNCNCNFEPGGESRISSQELVGRTEGGAEGCLRGTQPFYGKSRYRCLPVNIRKSSPGNNLRCSVIQ